MRAAWLVLPLALALACSQTTTSDDGEIETSSANLSATAKQKTAAFLDSSALAWVNKTNWSFVQGGRCVMSCHTTVPFMMVRAKLPASTATTTATATVRGLVEARVSAWATVAPLYSWVPADSRGLEAIVNALALVATDAPTGTLTPIAKKALANMWAEQKADGSFPWWSTFTLAPWENGESGLWGAALADVIVGLAPASYVAGMTPAETAKLAALETYLRGKATAPPLAPLHNRAMILLAAARRPTLLPATTRTQLASAIGALQAADGSWSSASLGFATTGSGPAAHPYATAYFTYVLATNGDAASASRVALGRAWLEAHQRADGAWEAKSLNAPTEDFNNRLITDGATAYAALALLP